MPTEASSSSGLTMSGKRRSLGRCDGRAPRADHEVRDADPLVGEHLLGERLVAREHEALGGRARVGHAQHLHHGRDRVVERRLAAEALREVEHDVGGLGAEPPRQLFEVVAKAEQTDLVALADQRARDVELGLVGRLELLLAVLRRRRLTVRVEENEHARSSSRPSFDNRSGGQRPRTPGSLTVAARRMPRCGAAISAATAVGIRRGRAGNATVAEAALRGNRAACFSARSGVSFTATLLSANV